MKKIIDYKVLLVGQVIDINPYEAIRDMAKVRKSLEEKVIRCINEEGYQPVGGIVITSQQPDCVLYLSQCMVKYEQK